MTVCPLVAVPPLPVLKLALERDDFCFDPHEHYIKQTVRNRYHILTANGVESLSIHVQGQKGEKTPTGSIQLDYKKDWVRDHLRAMESAYRSAPFYEHYFPYYEKFITTEYPNLLEISRAGWQLAGKLLQVDLPWSTAESFVEEAKYDLRRKIKSPDDFPADLKVRSYFQVFDDRFPFRSNLCVFDALFNLGPETISVLKG